MSTISVSGLSQFVQSVSVTPPTQTDDAVQTGATTDASSATSADASQQVQGGHHHHHGGGGGGAFFSKVQSAVSTALQQAQSGDATDPNQAIQNAIESVLKGGGDPTTDGSTTSSDPSTTDPSATTTASSDPQQSQSAFFQTLQQFGVDPQQFHQDFLSALQNAQNGNADPSSVFQSFPPGSAIDTTG